MNGPDMHTPVRISLFAAVLALGLVGYTQPMARIGPGTPPAMAPAVEQADAILAVKPTRELHLQRDGQVIRSDAISPGAAPEGHKRRDGDERTPSGRDVIDGRNVDMRVIRSLVPDDTPITILKEPQ